MELINKKDALHAVLHNHGDAAVAAVQNIKPINPHGELREMLINDGHRMNNAELITELTYHASIEKRKLLSDAADALEAADKRIAELEDELRFQLDTRRKETAEIEQLKAENLKLQKQNRDCGWNCKQCEYVDKDIQAEEAEQMLMELDRRLYERRLMNRRANDDDN